MWGRPLCCNRWIPRWNLLLFSQRSGGHLSAVRCTTPCITNRLLGNVRRVMGGWWVGHEGPEGLGLGVFFFLGDISLKRFGDVFWEVGKNAKVLVQLRNFPKVGFYTKCFKYGREAVYISINDSTERWNNLEKSFKIHFLWLNESTTPHNFTFATPRKWKLW